MGNIYLGEKLIVSEFFKERIKISKKKTIFFKEQWCELPIYGEKKYKWPTHISKYVQPRILNEKIKSGNVISCLTHQINPNEKSGNIHCCWDMGTQELVRGIEIHRTL